MTLASRMLDVSQDPLCRTWRMQHEPGWRRFSSIRLQFAHGKGSSGSRLSVLRVRVGKGVVFGGHEHPDLPFLGVLIFLGLFF